MIKILMIDNYDSFTYNLVHYLEDLSAEITVWRNDKFEIEDVNAFDKIILSPGPGIPDESGKLKEVIAKYTTTKPILGICLGHQAIAEVFGAKLVNLDKVYHGVDSPIYIKDENEYLFKGLPKTITVGRYHSWIVETPLPHELKITSIDENNYIMSFHHKKYDVRGVQFHPESILTPQGKQILENWIKH